MAVEILPAKIGPSIFILNFVLDILMSIYIRIVLMQEKSFALENKIVGSIPIIKKFLADVSFNDLLTEALGNADAVLAIETLVMSILVKPAALYRVGHWVKGFDDGLVSKTLTDDKAARALDRLFKADRASLLTKLVLSSAEKFKINLNQIHNDSTSIKFSGAYDHQYSRAVQLKRGHSKDHRPDLKQLVYSLCISRDGAIPIHFKSYDGNRTDDTTHWETWQSLRGILGRSDFLYVADSKLCVSESMKNIDREQGNFVTIVPKTRSEVAEFSLRARASQIRWTPVWKRKSSRRRKIDHFEVADGLFQLREGFRVYWYRSSEKQLRDRQNREGRLDAARSKLLGLNNTKRRGPKSERALKKASDKILHHYKVTNLLIVNLHSTEEQKYRQTKRGKSNDESLFRRTIQKSFLVVVTNNIEGVASQEAMDGIFPLTTNKEISALEVLKAYKFQPHLEKRHSLFKSILEISPVFLKRNDRIEALVFVHFVAQLIASLIERQLRSSMIEKKIESLPLLPEGRETKTPTISCIFDQFTHRSKHYLNRNGQLLQKFADPLSELQMALLKYLKVPATSYQ